MKVSREQAAQNRERILDAAAQLFRERGFEGIGVADLMKEAGLTHGGFYGHFSSKDDLIAQASARELTRSLAHWSKVGERASGDPLSAIAGALFDQQHIATIRARVVCWPRWDRTCRDRVRPCGAPSPTMCVPLVDLLAKLVPGKSKAARRRKAISTYATLVGAMVLARAVDDRALSQEILDAGLASVKA